MLRPLWHGSMSCIAFRHPTEADADTVAGSVRYRLLNKEQLVC